MVLRDAAQMRLRLGEDQAGWQDSAAMLPTFFLSLLASMMSTKVERELVFVCFYRSWFVEVVAVVRVVGGGRKSTADNSNRSRRLPRC